MVLAHVSHWAVNLVYIAPLVAIAIAMLVMTVRDRRRGPRDHPDDRPDSKEDPK